MAKITYDDKVALNEEPSIAAINKVSDDDMNEIKSSVNDLYDTVSTNTTDIGTNTLDISTLQGQTNGTYSMGNIQVEGIDTVNIFPVAIYNYNTEINHAHCTASINGDVFQLKATASDYCYLGEVCSNGSPYELRMGILIPVTPGEKITFTLSNSNFNANYITAFNSSKVGLGFTAVSSSTGTYTVPNNAAYITFRFGVGAATSGTTYSTTVMMERGATASLYSKNINLENDTNASVVFKQFSTTDSTTLNAFAAEYKGTTYTDIPGYTPILCYEVSGTGNASIRGYTNFPNTSTKQVGCWVVNFSNQTATVPGFDFKIIYIKNKL